MADPAIRDHRSEVRIPAQTVIRSQPWRDLPGVLHVQAEVSLPLTIIADRILRKTRWRTDEEIGHRQSGHLAVEREGARRIQIDPNLVNRTNVISAELDLMISANQTQVIGNLIAGRVQVAGICSSRRAVQRITHRYEQVLRNDFRDALNAQIGSAEERHLRLLDAGLI